MSVSITLPAQPRLNRYSPDERYGPRTLSPRERHVIELVAAGLTNRDVAEILEITEFVVKNYLRTIYDKIGVWNRLELALWYEARRSRVNTTP